MGWWTSRPPITQLQLPLTPFQGKK
uniref:Uncharacterized protein n=1 Tax=Anguilla anguilla TaxID=7936 RepID=A0A0E9T0T5_ANGAN